MASVKPIAQKIQDSLLKLAENKTAQDIDIALISKTSKVSIEEITTLYGSVEDIFWDILASLDSDALSVEAFSDDDSVHDKIFDLLMRRFERFEAHKPALINLADSMDEKSFKSLFVNNSIVRSMGWILEAAGVGTSGLDGEARKRALAWVFGTSFDAFLKEDDVGLPKTMMVLDRALSRVTVWQTRLNDATTLAKGAAAILASFIDNFQKRRQKASERNSSQSSDATNVHSD